MTDAPKIIQPKDPAKAMKTVLREWRKAGYVPKPRPRRLLDSPIEYIDPAPKPFIVQMPLVEYFERVKRHKADAWQIDFCDKLQKACEKRHIETVRAVVHAEAQLGKSVILAQCFPAWILGHDPLHRVALSTYNVSRSQAHSKAVIGIMNLPIHKEIFPIKGGEVNEKSSKEKWKTQAREKETTDAQDSFNPVGLQSGLTGSGFDTLIIDDPYADQKEAFSETVRQSLINFWEFTVMSRIGQHANVFGMFHRYHVEDLAGYLLGHAEFDYWRYASVCDGDYVDTDTGRRFVDPLGRKEGEYISERRGEDYYSKNRKNTRVWNAMFQGKPTSDEGDFFQIGNIEMVDEVDTTAFSVMVRAWDFSATKDGGDFTAGTLTGMTPDKQATILDAKHVQYDPAAVDKLLVDTAEEDGKEVVISIPIDPGAAGQTAVFHFQQLLKDYTVVTRPTSGSKEERARSFASAINSGDVSMVNSDWANGMKRELRNFPLSDRDDYVDSGADGYNECFERVSKGLVITGFRPQQNLITVEQLQAKTKNPWVIPVSSTIYVGLKVTAEASQANAGVIVARLGENTGLADNLFVVGEYKEFTANFVELFDWLNDTLTTYCASPKTALVWLHKDSESYQTTIRQKLKCGIRIFNEDAVSGLTEVGWYLKNGTDTFGTGATGLYGLVEASQLAMAVDGKGLISLRQEAATWRFNDKGEPNATGVVWDCLRMICYQFRTRTRTKTTEEKILEQIPVGTREAILTAKTADEKLGASLVWEFEREIAESKVVPDEEKYFEWE